MTAGLQRVAALVVRVCASLVLACLFGIALIRLAPGIGLDPQLEMLGTVAQRAPVPDVIDTFIRFWAGAWRGDFGLSTSMNYPVRNLLAERLPATAYTVLAGLAGAWACGLALASLSGWARARSLNRLLAAFNELLLCVPVAVAAVALFLFQLPAALGIAFVIYPKVYRYARVLYEDCRRQPHIEAARAQGLGSWTLFRWHVLPVAFPALAGVLGATVGAALGTAIPIEALTNQAGIGQLAWKAAMARDFPLLLPLIVIVTGVTTCANSMADLVSGREAMR
jgi:peptide/nickel transport system permease protein